MLDQYSTHQTCHIVWIAKKQTHYRLAMIACFLCQVACKFVVPLLLYYLFTAAFSWMLCEGVMLFLMLVVVFSSLSKKWWPFFIFGWGRSFFPPTFKQICCTTALGTGNSDNSSQNNACMILHHFFSLPILFDIQCNEM